VTNIIQLT